MNAEQFAKVKAAHKTLADAENELIYIAKDLQIRVHVAHIEVYPHTAPTYSRGNYWLTNTDRIKINLEDEIEGILAEYWDYGRCGNSDECLHVIEITEDLLTETGRTAYAEAWKVAEQLKLDTEEKLAREAKAKRISQLQAELNELKG